MDGARAAVVYPNPSAEVTMLASSIPGPTCFPRAVTALLTILVFGGPSLPSSPGGDASADDAAIAALQRDLRSQYPDKRRRTVTKLAALRGERAMELVLGALDDPSAEVADEAQLRVVAFEPEGVVDELLGKAGLRSKDRWIRLRAAEALGRMGGPVDAERLVRAFDRRDPEVLGATLWTLERLAEREALAGDPAKVVKKLDPFLTRRARDGVRAAALQALVRVDPGAARQAIERLRNVEDRRTACSVLEAAATLDPARAQGMLERAAAAEDPGVRAKAIEILARAARRQTLDVLVARLRAEPRPAIRGRLVAALRWLTGFRHGDKPDAWAHTVRSLPANWKASDVKNAYVASGRNEGTVAEIRRLQPGSDRLAILVDFSGSLWNVKEDGMRRKDLVDPEVVGLLERLDQNGSFFLVPFTGEPHPMTDEPIDATAFHVRKAQRFFRSATMRGKGNVYDAIDLALSFDSVDRILVMTDGAPTGGRRWNLELMVPLLLERTRFRPVTFDFVLFDAPAGLARRWEQLAERTGGRSLAVHF
ncbi:MAG: hypothetical protein AAGB93_11495 [Planctomycetota bacterium]